MGTNYTESVPRLFVRNERVVCVFQTKAGPMAVVLVAPFLLVPLKKCGQVKLHHPWVKVLK